MNLNYSRKLIRSAKVIENISGTTVPVLPENERQTRPLTKLSEPLQIKAWEKAAENPLIMCRLTKII